MIKKIIVLAISFVLTLGSVVYTETTNATPVKYGTGNGTAKTIASVDELTTLINSLPTASVYEENADVTSAEGYENFKGITIIENSETSTYSNYRDNVRLDNNPDLPEDEIEYFYSRNHEYSNKRLEMYFDTTCIYYHSIGTMWTAVEYYNLDLEGYYAGNLSDLEIAKCNATDLDIEVYFSKDRTLMKINKNESYYQEAIWDGKYYASGLPKYKKVDAPSTDEDDEPSQNEIYQEIAMKAINDNLGVWVELDMNATGVDDMEPDYDAIQNMTPEQQEEYAMNLIIEGLLSELSYVQVESIKQANLVNYAYLTRLSSFLIESIDKPNYYEVQGPKYKLINSYKVNYWQCNRCDKEFDTYTTTCPDCKDSQIIENNRWLENAKYEYLNALRPDWNASKKENYNYSGNIELVLGANTTINQKISRSYSNSNSAFGRFKEEIESYSAIFNVDNTKVNALKGSKVKTLDETYGKSFRVAFEQLLAQQQGGNN